MLAQKNVSDTLGTVNVKAGEPQAVGAPTRTAYPSTGRRQKTVGPGETCTVCSPRKHAPASGRCTANPDGCAHTTRNSAVAAAAEGVWAQAISAATARDCHADAQPKTPTPRHCVRT